MIDSVDFHGLNRHRVVKYLGIAASCYDRYHTKRLREWHIRHQLQKISKLSDSRENAKELLAAIKDVEDKIKRSYQEHPIDNNLLQDVMAEIKKVSRMLGNQDAYEAPPVQEPAEEKTDDQEHKKKLSMLESRYDEMKSKGNVAQLDGIRKTIQRMREQLKDTKK